MKLEQYLEEIKRTLPDLGDNFSNQLHMVIGLSTEAGELLDIFKKKFAYGKDIDYIQKAEDGFLVAIGKELNKGNWEFGSPNIQVITNKVKELCS